VSTQHQALDEWLQSCLYKSSRARLRHKSCQSMISAGLLLFAHTCFAWSCVERTGISEHDERNFGTQASQNNCFG
jgi:hypothetical protein